MKDCEYNFIIVRYGDADFGHHAELAMQSFILDGYEYYLCPHAVKKYFIASMVGRALIKNVFEQKSIAQVVEEYEVIFERLIRVTFEKKLPDYVYQGGYIIFDINLKNYFLT